MSSACVAAHSALYFQPDGQVRACCVTGFAIGSVIGEERQSLREIWEGAAITAQRRALESGSYELGCQECQVLEAAGGRQAALAFHFDRFAEGAPHVFPKMLDLALSSRCNLECVMCNGELSSAIRAKRDRLPPLPDCYDDRFFAELDEFLPHLERLQFKGGEPFLAPENRRIWDRLIELGLTPEVTVTTNGTVFNDRVAHYVSELRMHPNISVDAMRPETLEAIRVGVDAERLWHNIDRFQELAEVAGNGMTLSFCLMRTNWPEVLPFLTEVDRRGLNCNIIFVNQPRDLDLLAMQARELSTIHAELSSCSPDFENAEPRRAWSEVLERIRAQVEHPVEIVVHAPEIPPPSISASAQESLRADLHQRYGMEPVRIEADAGVVCAVEAADWAAWLDPNSWVERSLADLEPMVAEHAGPVVSSVLTPDESGISLMAVTVETPGGVRRLRLHGFTDPASGRRCMLLVEVPLHDD